MVKLLKPQNVVKIVLQPIWRFFQKLPAKFKRARLASSQLFRFVKKVLPLFVKEKIFFKTDFKK